MEISKTASSAIGILGLLCGVGGLAVYGIWPDFVILYTILEALAAVHLIVFFIAHFEIFKAVSKRRSTQLGLNSGLMTILVIAILAILNFIIAQHEARLDLSSGGAYTLSPQTISILQGIKEKVKISGFFQKGSQKVEAARELFENYRHQNKNVEYEFIDPDRQPAVAKQYGIVEYDTVVLESKGQSATITALSEQALTSAFIRISRNAKKQLYFVEGHGERGIDDEADRRGYGFLKKSLESQGFDVRKLVLLSEREVPSDAAVVIIAGPETAYVAEEEAALRRYLEKDGQMLVLLDPMTKNNLGAFLSEWGVVIGQELILDPSSGLGPAVPIVTPAGRGYLPHDITRGFQMATFYSLAQPVALDTSKAEVIRFDSFVQTGPQSWAVKNLTPPISLDPDRDRKGPIVLGGVFSKSKSPDTEAENGSDAAPAPPGMRLVVMGDSDFAANELVRAAGNGDFAQNIISWLAKENDLVSIRPKETQTETLILTANQQAGLFYFSVVIFPVGTLITGLLIYRKRRRL